MPVSPGRLNCPGETASGPGPARGAKRSPLAAERDQLVVAVVAAAKAHEATRQNAALQEGVEFVFDELRQVGTGSVLGQGEEGRRVKLSQAA